MDVSLFRGDVERSIVVLVARNFESPSQEDEYRRAPRFYPSSFVTTFFFCRRRKQHVQDKWYKVKTTE